MSVDTAIAVITLGELKTYFQGDTSSNTGYDGKYGDLINEVSELFNNYTHRHLVASTYQKDVNGNGSQVMSLNNFPLVSSGVTVCIDGTRAFTTDLNVSTSTIVVYEDEGMIALRNGIFSTGLQNVRVTFTAGYTSTSMPYALKRAAKEMCQFFWNRETKKDKVGIRTESGEGFSRTFETDMPWSVKQILEGYRDWSYG